MVQHCLNWKGHASPYQEVLFVPQGVEQVEMIGFLNRDSCTNIDQYREFLQKRDAAQSAILQNEIPRYPHSNRRLVYLGSTGTVLAQMLSEIAIPYFTSLGTLTQEYSLEITKI